MGSKMQHNSMKNDSPMKLESPGPPLTLEAVEKPCKQIYKLLEYWARYIRRIFKFPCLEKR